MATRGSIEQVVQYALSQVDPKEKAVLLAKHDIKTSAGQRGCALCSCCSLRRALVAHRVVLLLCLCLHCSVIAAQLSRWQRVLSNLLDHARLRECELVARTMRLMCTHLVPDRTERGRQLIEAQVTFVGPGLFSLLPQNRSFDTPRSLL